MIYDMYVIVFLWLDMGKIKNYILFHKINVNNINKFIINKFYDK